MLRLFFLANVLLKSETGFLIILSQWEKDESIDPFIFLIIYFSYCEGFYCLL